MAVDLGSVLLSVGLDLTKYQQDKQQLLADAKSIQGPQVKASLDTGGYRQQLDQAVSDTKSATDRMMGFFAELRKVGISIFAGREVLSFGKDVVNALTSANRQLDTMRTNLAYFTGSFATASARLKEIEQFKFQNPNPFSYQELVKLDTQLTAIGVHSKAMFTDLVNAAAALKGRVEDPLQSLTTAITQIRGGRFTGAFRTLSGLGISRSDLEAAGLQDQGRNVVGSIDNVLASVQKLLHERFDGFAQIQAQTLDGMLARMKGWAFLAQSILTQPFYDGIKAVAAKLNDPHDGLFTEDNLNRLRGFMAGVQNVFDVLGADAARGIEAVAAGIKALAANAAAGGPALIALGGGAAAAIPVIMALATPLEAVIGLLLRLGSIVIGPLIDAAVVAAPILAIASAIAVWVEATKKGQEAWSTFKLYFGDSGWLKQMGHDFQAVAAMVEKFFTDIGQENGGVVLKDLKLLGEAAFNALVDGVRGLVTIAGPALAGFVQDMLGGLADLLKDAYTWGANLVGSFFKGMIDAAQALAAATMNAIIDTFRGFIEGHSPPTLGPLKDITVWGQKVSQAWLDGFTHADFSVFDQLSTLVENHLRAMVDTGDLERVDLIPTLLGDRDTIGRILDQYRQGFLSMADAVHSLQDALAPLGPNLQAAAEAIVHIADLENQIHQIDEQIKPLEAEIRDLRADETPVKEQIDDYQTLLDQNTALRDSIQAQKDLATEAYAERLSQLQTEHDAIQANIDAVKSQYDVQIDGINETIRGLQRKRDLEQAADQTALAPLQIRVAQDEVAAAQETLARLRSGKTAEGKPDNLTPAERQRQIDQALLSVAEAQNRVHDLTSGTAVQLKQVQANLADVQNQQADALSPLQHQLLLNQGQQAQTKEALAKASAPFDKQLDTLKRQGQELSAQQAVWKARLALEEAGIAPLQHQLDRLNAQKERLQAQEQPYKDALQLAQDRETAEQKTASLLKEQADLLKDLADQANKKGKKPALGEPQFSGEGFDLPNFKIPSDLGIKAPEFKLPEHFADGVITQIEQDFERNTGKLKQRLGQWFKDEIQGALKFAVSPEGIGAILGGIVGFIAGDGIGAAIGAPIGAAIGKGIGDWFHAHGGEVLGQIQGALGAVAQSGVGQKIGQIAQGAPGFLDNLGNTLFSTQRTGGSPALGEYNTKTGEFGPAKQQVEKGLLPRLFNSDDLPFFRDQSWTTFPEKLGDGIQKVLVPALQRFRDLLDPLKSTWADFQKLLGDLGRDTEGPRNALGLLGEAAAGLAKTFGAQGLVAALTAVVDFLHTSFKVGIDTADALIKTFDTTVQGITKIFGDVVRLFGDLVHGDWTRFTHDLQQVTDDTIAFVINLFTGTAGGLLKVLGDVATGIGTITHDVLAAFGLWDGIVDLIADPFNAALKFVGEVVNKIIDAINWVITKFGADAIPSWQVPQLSKPDRSGAGRASAAAAQAAQGRDAHTGTGSTGPGGAGTGTITAAAGAAIFDRAQTLTVGEASNPAFPEFFINTNAQDLSRQWALWQMTGERLAARSHGDVPRQSLRMGLGDILTGPGEWVKSHLGQLAGLPGDALDAVMGFLKDGAEKTFEKALEAVGFKLPSIPAPFDKLPQGILAKVKDLAVKAFGQLFDSGGSALVPKSGSVVPTAQQANLIRMALRLAGAPESWVDQIAWIVAHEDASWDAGATNPTPVGPAGEHATGIMQTLPSTFAAYALPGHGDIRNPLDNLIAGIRYIMARYGSPYNSGLVASESAGIGYATGTGFVKETGPATVHRGELIVQPGAADGSDRIVDLSDDTIARFKAALDQSLSDFEGWLLQNRGAGFAGGGIGTNGVALGGGAPPPIDGRTGMPSPSVGGPQPPAGGGSGLFNLSGIAFGPGQSPLSTLAGGIGTLAGGGAGLPSAADLAALGMLAEQGTGAGREVGAGKPPPVTPSPEARAFAKQMSDLADAVLNRPLTPQQQLAAANQAAAVANAQVAASAGSGGGGSVKVEGLGAVAGGPIVTLPDGQQFIGTPAGMNQLLIQQAYIRQGELSAAIAAQTQKELADQAARAQAAVSLPHYLPVDVRMVGGAPVNGQSLLAASVTEYNTYNSPVPLTARQIALERERAQAYRAARGTIRGF